MLKGNKIHPSKSGNQKHKVATAAGATSAGQDDGWEQHKSQ